MALMALSTISVFSARDMVTGNTPSPFKAFSHICCINTASIFTFHNPKWLSPVNFSVFHFEPMVLDYRLILAPRWALIVVNSMRITPITNLMCGASDNQATKTKCMEVINTSKSRKQREKERENTKFVYSVQSKTGLNLRERAALRFTIIMSNFTKEISMSYKNKSFA